MYSIVFLLAVVGGALGASLPPGMLPQLDGRIVGGEAATINSYPYQVSIQRDGVHVCGGAIYNARFIITAAHCVITVPANTLRIRAGSTYWNTGGQFVIAYKTIIHEGYNPITLANDIAIVQLNSALTLTTTVKAIAMASSNPNNGASAVVTGWGSQTYGSPVISKELRVAKVDVITRGQCASSNYGYGSEILPAMFCASASGKDACQGDSGGPLVSNNALVGIVSWGYGCAVPNFPGVYTSVAEFYYWIQNNAK